MIEDKRLRLALTICEPNRLDEQYHNKDITVDILLCDLKHIHQILNGDDYYDYEAQEWVESITR